MNIKKKVVESLTHLLHTWYGSEVILISFKTCLDGRRQRREAGRDPSLICHIPGASWPNTQSTRLGFTGMDYPAGLTFSQVGSPVQIILPLHVSISPRVREDNNTALISPVNWKSLCHC